jgi:vacuolar-type H+-ATPase subunit C/Vma6
MQKQKPRFKGYISLFEKFEKHLTRTNPVFESIDYSIQYILTKKAGTSDFEIEVIFKLNSKPSWVMFINEPQTISEMLSSYAMIFSITNVRILISRTLRLNLDCYTKTQIIGNRYNNSDLPF